MVDQGPFLVRAKSPRDGYSSHYSIGDAVVFGLASGRCALCTGVLDVRDVGLASFAVVVAPSLNGDDPNRYVSVAHQECGVALRALIARTLDGND